MVKDVVKPASDDQVVVTDFCDEDQLMETIETLNSSDETGEDDIKDMSDEDFESLLMEELHDENKTTTPFPLKKRPRMLEVPYPTGKLNSST